MTAMGSWVLMTWAELASYLILSVLAAGLVGLLVGYWVRVRAEQAPQPEVVARQRALEQLAARYPVAFTHLLDEALADAGVPSVPSPALLPYATDTTDGGPRG